MKTGVKKTREAPPVRPAATGGRGCRREEPRTGGSAAADRAYKTILEAHWNLTLGGQDHG